MDANPAQSKALIRDNFQRILLGAESALTIPEGNFNAIAGKGGKAIVNVYQQKSPYELSLGEIEKDRAKLSAIPVDVLPEIDGLPGGSRMAFGSNPLFVGRLDDLTAIAVVLKTGSVVVSGIGGVGKTQLAIEFVYRYGQFFNGGVFWLSFENPAAIQSEIASCGGALSLHPNFQSLPVDQQVRLVSVSWQIRPCLLIFDNCEDEILYSRWRPPSGPSKVIVTSRKSNWDISLGIEVYELGVLKRYESISLLTKHLPDSKDDKVLDEIANELGDLALALHLAGGFLARYKTILNPTEFLDQLQDQGLLPSINLWRARV